MQSVKLLFIAFFGLALVVAGCDSQGGTTTPDPNEPIGPEPGGGQIELVQPLPDTTMFDSDTTRISLSAYFRHTEGQNLSYTFLSSHAGLVVAVDNSDETVGPRLVLTPFENVFVNENASVVVTAISDGPDRSQISDTLLATIVDDCPRAPEGDVDDYFPIRDPLEWVFDYEAERSDDFHDIETRWTGTFTYSVNSQQGHCTNFERRYDVTGRKEGTLQRRFYTYEGWTPWSDPEPFLYVNQAYLLETESTIDSFFGFGIQRYWSASSPDTVLVVLGDNCSSPESLKLTRGVGPTYLTAYCFNSAGSSSSEYVRR